MIQNTVNGKCYVGSAVNFGKRWATHTGYLKKVDHHSQKLQRAWDKHGEEAFEFSIIEYIPLTGVKSVDRDLLLPREDYWIETLDAVKNGYNVAPKAGSNLGCALTPEAKANYASAQKRREEERLSAGIPHPLAGRPRPPEVIARILATKAAKEAERIAAGIPHPRAGVSHHSKDKKRSPEEFANRSAGQKRRKDERIAAGVPHHNKGRKLPEESRRKTSESLRHTLALNKELGIPHPKAGKPWSAESIAKLVATRAANKAKKLAEAALAASAITED